MTNTYSEELSLLHLRNYKASNYQGMSHSIWNRLPISRRASVFVLLFLGQLGELRVILTKRSSKLRSFPGHISFPGGKADTGLESEWQVARREMEEEIGLSSKDDYLKQEYGIEMEHIATLPCYLSRNLSAVKPCIGFMRFDENKEESIQALQLTLNPDESSSIFSCPLRDFVYPEMKNLVPYESIERTHNKLLWGGIPWSLRSYIFPYINPNEVSWLNDIQDTSASDDDTEHELLSHTSDIAPSVSRSHNSETNALKKIRLESWGRLGSRKMSGSQEKIYDVWGLTANILHDIAIISYGDKDQQPKVIGEEELIYSLWNYGNQLRHSQRSAEEKKLIESRTSRDFGFNDILPRSEYLKLKNLYKI